jgi:hypothetical protein
MRSLEIWCRFWCRLHCDLVHFSAMLCDVDIPHMLLYVSELYAAVRGDAGQCSKYEKSDLKSAVHSVPPGDVIRLRAEVCRAGVAGTSKVQ